MIIAYLFAGVLGAVATAVVLLPYSWLLALLCAPFGGSGLMLVVALVVSVGVSLPKSKRESSPPTFVA
jgi:hypothetical protein